MEITKRNGMAEPYNKEKVAIAIRKSFASTGQSVTDAFMPKPKTISFIAGNGQNGEKPSTT